MSETTCDRMAFSGVEKTYINGKENAMHQDTKSKFLSKGFVSNLNHLINIMLNRFYSNVQIVKIVF